MYFKSLEMQGFKSFAEKTVLEIGSGITAVVGPNGSGKSNISDAIRWVLGEQSPKSLRGGKMEDVIFAGTENRKPVSFAEVSIVMDNSDGALNVDYDTVKVTRRLFRSGDSEYLVNGKQARLKDIYLLFADTGIGKEGYSIIGQGQVDEILSTKSEDRRGIFEEASGIMKYRMRKQESERKLAAAEQNILRIDDIISELETQIASLKKQAVSAEQYLKLKYELRDIEVGVLVFGICEAENKLSEIKANYEQVSGEIAENEEKTAQIRTENEAMNAKAETLEAAYNAAKEGAFEASRSITEISAEVNLNSQKIETLKSELRRMELENEQKNQLAQDQKKQVREDEEERRSILAELRELEEGLRKEQQKLDIVVSALSGGSEQANAKNREYIEDKLKIERLSSETLMLRKSTDIYSERADEIRRELESGRDEREKAKENLKLLEDTFREENENLSDLEKKFEAGCKNRDALETQLEEKTVRLGDVKTAIDTCQAQLKLLREMEENFEGYAKSVKEILTLCRENRDFGYGIHGAVAQVITVEKQDEAAIEVALGNTFQDIITEDEDCAKRAIEYLKDNRLGRATFLPLTAVNAKYMDADTEKKLKTIRGYVGIGSNLVKYKPEYEGVVGSLLGRVAVFEDIDSAIFAAKQTKYGFMCVTRDGDILRTSGAITGGSPEKGKRGGALSRTREIPEYEALLAQGQKKFSNLSADIERMKNEMKNEAAEVARLSDAIKAAEVRVAKLSAELTSVRGIVGTMAERENSLTGEISKQNALMEESAARILQVEDEKKALEAALVKLEAELATLEESERALSGQKERHQNAITELKLRQADSSGRKQRLDGEIARLEQEIRSGGEFAVNVQQKSKEARETEQLLTAKNGELTGRLAEQRERKSAFDADCTRLYGEKKENDGKIKQTFDLITDITTKTGYLREEAGRLEMRRMRQEHDLEYNKARLWDEYELTYTKAFELTGGEKPDNLEESKKRIGELRNAIKRLGNVNVGSIEELKSTSERYDFLTAQRKDVAESRAKLTKIIAELETVMRRQFQEQFKTIRENFRTVFTELFGGGKADIELTDEANCLECGIEINVQPPGKKLQNMMLLSGGERALTAIALLFGILKMRPTPFCMLDEIESALDDANVYRFARYTKSLSHETQLILITHRKGTMESADSLYGVTMEEKGVSKVVSVKL